MNPDLIAIHIIAPRTREHAAAAGSMLAELEAAQAAHGPMRSLHEAHAVIAEELDELWDLVRAKREARDPRQVRRELVQVGAMAMRAIIDLGLVAASDGGAVSFDAAACAAAGDDADDAGAPGVAGLAAVAGELGAEVARCLPLGATAHDTVTGFVGTVTAVCRYIVSGDRCELSPIGSAPGADPRWFDVARVRLGTPGKTARPENSASSPR